MKTEVEKKGGAARVLKIIGLVVLSIIILAAIGLFMLSKRPAAPKNYTSTVKTGGEIEATYIAMGQHEVKSVSMAGMHSFKQFEMKYGSQRRIKSPFRLCGRAWIQRRNRLCLQKGRRNLKGTYASFQKSKTCICILALNAYQALVLD